MPSPDQQPKDVDFHFDIDPRPKAAGQTATEAADKPAAQVLRDFMRAYGKRKQQGAIAIEARRNSRALSERAADPGSDEAEILRWIEDVSDPSGWTARSGATWRQSSPRATTASRDPR